MDSPPSLPPRVHGLPTPPDSPRKRRNILRSSEETRGFMSIEEFLVRSDPYRSTTVPSPWPYPIVETPAPSNVNRTIQAHKERICQILASHDFPSEENLRLFVDDVTKPGYPGGNRPVRVLHVVYYNNVRVPHRLGPAKDEIHALLRRNGIRDIHVEIIIKNRAFRPSLFAIHPDHPAANAYMSAKREIKELLLARLGRAWNFLSMLNVGLDNRKTTPSIVVYVEPLTKADWHSLSGDILLKLPPNHPWGTTIKVEFLPGRTGLLLPPAPQHNGKSMVDEMREDGVPVPGTSIGVLPEVGGGSLGPFVMLRQNNQYWRGALTNYHVVQPPSSAPPNVIEQASRFGSELGKDDARNVEVHYFAVKDKEMTDYELQKEIEASKDSLSVAKKDMEFYELVGKPVPEAKMTLIKAEETRLSSLEKKLQVVNSMPIKIGKVSLSSGRRLISGKVHDWAFLTLEQTPFRSNPSHLKNKMPHVPNAERPIKYLMKPRILLPEEAPLQAEFGRLNTANWYCKVGRTTGVTAGLCNGVRADVQWSDTDRRRYNVKGDPVQVQQGVTEEWIIVNEQAQHEGGRVQGPFCMPGDSGAGIISSDGQVSGLLYAGTTALAGFYPDTTIGLLMDMPDIRAAIEGKTAIFDAKGNRIGPGATLELP